MSTRDTALSESLEDYLETILELTREHGHAHVNDIALRRGVKKSSANCALRSLQKKNLVVYEKYQPVLLTPEGEAIAAAVLGKHEVLTRFFLEKIGMELPEAQEVACKLEHVLDEPTLAKMIGLFRTAKKRQAHCKHRHHEPHTDDAECCGGHHCGCKKTATIA